MSAKSFWIWIVGWSAVILLVISTQSVSCDENPKISDKCRVSDGSFLEPGDFALYSCAKCYRHMDARLFANGTKLQQRGIWLINPETNERYEPYYLNRSSPIFKTFRTSKQINLWISCCEAAVECCKTLRKTPLQTGNVCPRTWDGWNCWPDTPAGTIQEAPCPSYIYFNSDKPQCTRYATKTCWDNGTWFINFKGNEYSDYSTCGQGEDIKLLLKTHVITFGISIVLLIPALVIFFYYRQLRVHRIFMHKNLFIALLLTAVCVTVFESYFIIDSLNNPNSVLESNQAGCKLFYTLTKYMRLSTYMWMFCEGFYLHKLIAAAFAEQKGVLIFYAIGWGVPFIPVGIWAITRQVMADELCWTVPGYFEWIIYVPMLAALLVNFCFLAHIVQIIITKLRSTNTNEPAQFRRAVRATMVLIPLFGLHFLFLSYNHGKDDCHMLLIYNLITYSMDGLQGGLVALLFCYLNNEVLYLLKRSYNRKKMVHDIASHMSSRRTRESRTSVSTNADSLANDNALLRGVRKK
ncbi:calcitonin gene-related peptide type 1 receptor [Trichonephila clavata]|uniref:Calcitonin gene-related peptide type 1 receptor n=1 Tax=Trichonephila clavata TaxID=2740835 RepID=A0A8X6F1I8_TRICU|nr:calcitonin gene-related peptide type 1 receptor [Trichonephila clavata]